MGGESICGEQHDQEEDEQPPLKRMKFSSPPPPPTTTENDATATITATDSAAAAAAAANNNSNTSMAKAPPQESEMVGGKRIIRRIEFVRIITQALYSLGYDRAAALLEEESGISLQLPIVSSFRKDILEGRWDDGVKTLSRIGPLDSQAHKAAAFLILQQKFLEQLVWKGDTQAALRTLRSELSPLQIQTQRIHELASCIVCPGKEDLLSKVEWKGYGAEARMSLLVKIQELLPAHIMIPERRLENLIEQSLTVQRDGCIYHNTSDNSLCLYTDHKCGRDQIPTETLQVLEAHENEVWYLQFSRDGRHLASASRDCTAIIWEVVNGDHVKLKHTLIGHRKPVSFVAWSPDDSMVLTCGTEEAVKLWDSKTGECKHTYEKAPGLTSCAWFPDGKSLVTGCPAAIFKWDLNGAELDVYKWARMQRINDLAISPDGKHVICITCDKLIRILNLEDKSERDIEENDSITSLSVSLDGKYLLVNLVSQEIHLWDMTSSSRLPSMFKGHRQGRFVIRSCLGGSDFCFIASGSEDSQVYIWHRGNGELLEVLSGHAGTVNCVSWNPKNPHMFASASDDHTIRIWGLKSRKSTIGGGSGSGSSSSGGSTTNCCSSSGGSSSTKNDNSTSKGSMSNHHMNGGTRELLQMQTH